MEGNFSAFNTSACGVNANSIGDIEVTDIVALQHEKYGLVAMRQDTTSTFNALLVVNENQVLQTIPVAGSPDGMKASPEGR